MIKKIIILALLVTATVSANAKIKFGLRGGLNITEMSFNKDVWSASNKTGFFIGPTVKFGLPFGLDIDASAIYNQIEADSELHITKTNGYYSSDDKFETLKRKTLAIPLNIRKGFGFGDKFDVFIFAGPQFDFNVGGDITQDYVDWTWRSSAFSINAGAGVMLLNHLEARFNYNIPLSTAGEFKFDKAVQNVSDQIDAKAGAWQIGVAYYF